MKTRPVRKETSSPGYHVIFTAQKETSSLGYGTDHGDAFQLVIIRDVGPGWRQDYRIDLLLLLFFLLHYDGFILLFSVTH